MKDSESYSYNRRSETDMILKETCKEFKSNF